MLQALRDKTSGWIAIVIVLILAVPFAFFGMEQYLFQSGGNYAAKVEAPPSWWRSAPDLWPVRKAVWQSEEISTESFRSRFEQARQQQRQAQGESFDARAFESIESKREVLDGLVDQAVMRLFARRADVAIGDTRVRDEIQAVPAFQVDGVFDAQRYQLALQSQIPPVTPREFEQQVRGDLEQALIPSRIAQSAFVTEAELVRLMKLLGERRDVAMAVLPAPDADTGPVSAKELQDWHAAHGQDYRAPERVSIEYVEVLASALPPVPAADDATLRARYAQEQARFVEADQRLASHLLVRVEEGADAAAQAAAERKAKALAEQARKPGADFAALVRANSDDAGSKDAGGDLGWIEKGMMEGPFEDALFAMEAGAVQGPVKTDFGWHVIQLREARSGTQVPFEDVREQLASEQAESDRDRGFNELIGKLVDEVYRNPSSLVPAARAAGIPVQKAGPFARGTQEGVAANAAVQRAAFSEALVQDGTVSDPIELAPGHSVLIRVTEHAPERALPLSEVRAQVVAAIRKDRALKAAEQQAEAVVARMRGGATLQAALDGRADVQEVAGVNRGAPMPDPAATAAYFQAAAPAAGKVTPGKVELADGRFVVFAVSRVVPGDPADATPQEREQLETQLAQVVGNEDATALLRALRLQTKVTVVDARL